MHGVASRGVREASPGGGRLRHAGGRGRMACGWPGGIQLKFICNCSIIFLPLLASFVQANSIGKWFRFVSAGLSCKPMLWLETFIHTLAAINPGQKHEIAYANAG